LNFDLDQHLQASSKIVLKNSDLLLEQKLNQLDEFLKLYGDRITKLCNNEYSNLDILERFHLMPNIQEFAVILGVREKFPKNPDENHKIRLGKLTLLTQRANVDWNIVSYFEFDELQIENYYDDFNFLDYDEVYDWPNIDAIENCGNLKKFTANNCNENVDLQSCLSNFMSLESLEFNQVNALDVEFFTNYLKSSTRLTSLTLGRISNNICEVICENLVNLEELSVQFDGDVHFENPQMLTNLKRLKKLKIDERLTRETFTKLSKVIVPSLHTLNIRVNEDFSSTDIESFGHNFRQIKSLHFCCDMTVTDEIFISFFVNFNKLEALDISWNNDDLTDDLHAQKFLNSNLKSLTMNFGQNRLRENFHKLIERFPNLEHLKVNFILHENVIEAITSSLKNLKTLKLYQNQYQSFDGNLELFKKFGRHLQDVGLDLNEIDEPDEVLKRKSLILNERRVMVRSGNEKEMKLQFNDV
jgi:hypothetical protein